MTLRLGSGNGDGAAVRTRETAPEGRSGAGPDALAQEQRGLEQGTRVGRFVIVGTCGRGGMGVVYTAYDPELDRKVALKLLRVGATDSTSASQGRMRLQREAQAMKSHTQPAFGRVDCQHIGDCTLSWVGLPNL